MKKIYLISLILMMLTSSTSAQDLPDIEVLTWSEDIKIGDTYQWNVNKFAFNGTSVNDMQQYGIKEGSIITLTVDVQLSEVNVAPYLTSEQELPDVNEYVTIDVDGVESNISIFHPGMLILPTELTLTGGSHLNALFAASLNNVVFFSAENSFDSANSEYSEYNSSQIEEIFVWEVYLGVLKSINIHWEEDLELHVSVVNPDQFNTQTTTSSTSDPVSEPTRNGNGDDTPISLLPLITIFIAVPFINRKFRS